IRILELIRRDDTLRARSAAAAWVERVPFNLANGQLFFVDVRQNAAGCLAVEADAWNNPVAAAVLSRPARRLVVDVVIPGRRIWMGREGHGHQESGTPCPASTHTYSHAKLAASARPAAPAAAIVEPTANAGDKATIGTSAPQKIAPPQNSLANAP